MVMGLQASQGKQGGVLPDAQDRSNSLPTSLMPGTSTASTSSAAARQMQSKSWAFNIPLGKLPLKSSSTSLPILKNPSQAGSLQWLHTHQCKAFFWPFDYNFQASKIQLATKVEIVDEFLLLQA